MAEPDSGNVERKQVKSVEYDPELDFFSESFNPLKALQTPGLKPPCQNATKYDNLAKYEAANIKGQTAPKINKNNLDQPGPSTEFKRNFLPHQMPVKSERPKRVQSDIFTKMESTFGPLVLLKKCVEQELKVKIWTRTLRGIRGYCIGRVVLFDKHWNLLLEDVIEVFTRRKKSKTPALAGEEPTKEQLDRRPLHPPEVTIIKIDKKTVTCQRQVDRLVIRGEQVAVIATMP